MTVSALPTPLPDEPRASVSHSVSFGIIPSAVVGPSRDAEVSRSPSASFSQLPSYRGVPSRTPLLTGSGGCILLDALSFEAGPGPHVVRCHGSEEPVLVVSGEFEEAIVVGPADPELVGAAEAERLASVAVDVRLAAPGHVPETELCFALHSDVDDDSCLGYIDESKSPPEWVCEDSCLEVSDGMACGTTDHFTNFAILLDGGGNAGFDPCASSSSDYVTGEWWGDIALAGGCMMSCFVLGLLFVWLVTFYKPTRNAFRGPDGTRALEMRNSTDSTFRRTVEFVNRTTVAMAEDSAIPPH